MVPIISPVDEFWSMTRPRNLGEQRLRVMLMANLELELVQRVTAHVPEMAGEAIEPSASSWRAIDLGSQAVVSAIEDADRPDEMSLYARRLLGESAVMCQRLVVRQPALRVALTGDSDDGLDASTAVLDEVIGCRGRPLAQDDDRLHALHPALVGHADHGTVGDRVVRADALLDLDRVDVLGRRLDHPGLGADEADRSVGLPSPEVVGVVPPAGEARRVELGAVVVPVHHGRPAGGDLAGLAETPQGQSPRHLRGR